MAGPLAAALREWLERNRETLAARGTVAEFAQAAGAASAAASSARIDFETPKVVARFVVWERGFADVEVLDSASEKQMVMEHHDRVTPEGVQRVLDEIAARLVEWS